MDFTNQYSVHTIKGHTKDAYFKHVHNICNVLSSSRQKSEVVGLHNLHHVHSSTISLHKLQSHVSHQTSSKSTRKFLLLKSPRPPPHISTAKVGSCGGNYTAPSDVIYSPDFPDKYASGRVCYWTIHVPGASALLFNFTFFDISDQTDMVELLDGHSNRVLARFDGRHPPREVLNVTADYVILYFYSDRTNRAQGFALLYQGEPIPRTGTTRAL